MARTRRLWRAASSVAVLALLVTACGGDSGAAGGDDAEQASDSGNGGDAGDDGGDGGAGGGLADQIAAADPSGVTVELARFFGDCDDSTQGVTDVNEATSECEVIQILTNQFNAENEHDITVDRLGGAEWGTYYDALNTTFAGGSPPGVAVMHGSNLTDYVQRNVLVPLDDVLDDLGLDPDDWTDAARDAVTGPDGNIYGVPFDLHADLFHLNLDVLDAAGLVEGGEPVLPSSPEELLEHAEAVADAGYRYVAFDASEFPAAVRLLLTLVWQQGSDLIGGDGGVTIDTAEATAAVELLNTLLGDGHARPTDDYTGAQGSFLNGETAVMVNGTWAVDQYNRESPFEYAVADFPDLYGDQAVWANSHLWVLPRQDGDDPAAYRAGLEFMAFLQQHVGDWAAGTGHLAPNHSALASEQVQQAPHRPSYEATATGSARMVPAVLNWAAVEDILKEELHATWLTGKDIDRALADAQARVEEVLD